MKQSYGAMVEFEGFQLDTAKRLLRRHDGEIVSLTPKVFETLMFLVENNGRVIEKDELMAAIWPDTVVEENNLSQNISILRRVLGENRGEHRFIATIPGRGFKFVADVRDDADSEERQPFSAREPAKLADRAQTDTTSASERNEAEKINGSRKRARFLILVGGIVVIAAAFAILYWSQVPAESRIKSIAVLPFKPLVAENSDEALQMGMADTLIARLSAVKEITLRPLSSVRRYSALDQDAQRAGADLVVDAVLDGSIQRWGDRIRVNVRLIGTSDGRTLWNDTFDEKFSDIFVVQDTIAQRVVTALALRLSPEKRAGTENVEAYRFYLQGRYHALKSTPPDIRQGIEFYKQAITADPLYALAYAGMAQAYAALPITSDVRPDEAFPQAKAAANKALEIDPNLGDAHIILGVVEFWYEWDWVNAEAEMKRAIELNPNSPDAHRFYAVLLTALGRFDQSLTEMETARQLDPLSLLINSLKGQVFFFAGRDTEAIDQIQKTFEIDPNFWIARLMLARIYIRQEKLDDAIGQSKMAAEFSGGNSEALSLTAYSLARSDRRTEAMAILRELNAKSEVQYVPAYNIAMIYNGLGEHVKALDELEKAVRDRDARLILLRIEPKWDNFRSEPRFTEIMRKTGLN